MKIKQAFTTAGSRIVMVNPYHLSNDPAWAPSVILPRDESCFEPLFEPLLNSRRPETMRDKRGMRGKVLPVRLRDLFLPRLGWPTRRWRGGPCLAGGDG
jgi:hypothetical protein